MVYQWILIAVYGTFLGVVRFYILTFKSLHWIAIFITCEPKRLTTDWIQKQIGESSFLKLAIKEYMQM